MGGREKADEAENVLNIRKTEGMGRMTTRKKKIENFGTAEWIHLWQTCCSHLTGKAGRVGSTGMEHRSPFRVFFQAH